MGPSQHLSTHGSPRGGPVITTSRSSLGFIALLAFSILLSLAFFLPSTIAPYLLELEKQPVYQCGNSPEEARNNGCLFDVISFSWLPPACFDAELVEDFLATSKWQWYKDNETRTAVHIAEVYEGQHESLYVSWDYHFSHCAYMWTKMHRAVLHGYPIDGYIGNIHHTAHCSDLLLRQADFRASGKTTMIFTKYPSCGEDISVMGTKGYSGWYRMQNGSRKYEVPGGRAATVEQQH